MPGWAFSAIAPRRWYPIFAWWRYFLAGVGERKRCERYAHSRDGDVARSGGRFVLCFV